MFLKDKCIVRHPGNDLRPTKEIIFSGNNGNASIGLDLLIPISPLLRNVLHEYPVCLTPTVIMPDVKIHILNKFENIITYVASGGLDNILIKDEAQQKELQELCDILAIDKTMLPYQEKETYQIDNNCLNNEYSIEYLMMDENDQRGDDVKLEMMRTYLATANSSIKDTIDQKLSTDFHHIEDENGLSGPGEEDFEDFVKEIDAITNEAQDKIMSKEVDIKSEPIMNHSEMNLSCFEFTCAVCSRQYTQTRPGGQ